MKTEIFFLHRADEPQAGRTDEIKPQRRHEAQSGGAGNPKSEIRNPKEIRIKGRGENWRTGTGDFARCVRASLAFAVHGGKPQPNAGNHEWTHSGGGANKQLNGL